VGAQGTLGDCWLRYTGGAEEGMVIGGLRHSVVCVHFVLFWGDSSCCSGVEIHCGILAWEDSSLRRVDSVGEPGFKTRLGYWGGLPLPRSGLQRGRGKRDRELPLTAFSSRRVLDGFVLEVLQARWTCRHQPENPAKCSELRS
jgi:hypothetical protein